MTAVGQASSLATGVAAAPVPVPAAIDDDLIGPGALDVCPWLVRHGRSDPSRVSEVFKRLIDLTVVAVLAVPVLLVLAVATLLIKVESPGGPILHRQERTGYRQNRFTVYKLRTMVPDAEEMKQRLRHLNEREWPDFKITNDPRILKCGRLFRKTSIDELPQLWNVLVGDMTLVGPRPTTLNVDAYRQWQLSRFTTKPGLTGLWQVSARRDPSFVQRTRLDLAYLDRRDTLLDMEILLRTVLVAAKGEGT